MWREGPLSLAYLTIDGAGPVEHVETAAVAGFDAAGLRIQSPSHIADRSSIVGDRALIRDIRRALASTGLKALDAEVLTLAEGATAQSYLPMLDAAAEIGFAFVQVVGEDPDLARATDLLDGIAELTAERGMGVALEFMHFRAISTIEEASTMCATIARPNLGLLLDPLHLARSGGSPAEVQALAHGTIALAQLCDAPAGPPRGEKLAEEARGGRLHAGDGALPLHAFLDALPTRLPISVEVPNAAYAHLPAKDRATRAGEMAQRFLKHYLDERCGAKSG